MNMRLTTPGDYPWIINCVASREFCVQWSGTNYTYPLTIGQLEEAVTKGQTTEEAHFYTLEEEGKPVGHIKLRIDRDNQMVHLGTVLVDPHKRGQGIGTLLVKKALVIAFGQYKAHRVELGVFAFNKGALRAYEKAGFQVEGLLRDIKKMGDQFWSLYLMSILEDEYKAERE